MSEPLAILGFLIQVFHHPEITSYRSDLIGRLLEYPYIPRIGHCGSFFLYGLLRSFRMPGSQSLGILLSNDWLL
jgi:hypothetical protein